MDKALSWSPEDMVKDLDLGNIRAKRLADAAGIDVLELKNKKVEKVVRNLRFKLDPMKLFGRKICGRVVKTDPETGEQYPVPFAKVYVQDTDLRLLILAPREWPWVWFNLLRSESETIATAKTDRCGNFCAWVPRFELDTIRRWRLRHHCLLEVFQRPRIADMIKDLHFPHERPHIPPVGPDFDPMALFGNKRAEIMERLADIVPDFQIERLNAELDKASLTSDQSALQEILQTPASRTTAAPPLPAKFRAYLKSRQAGETMAEPDFDALPLSANGVPEIDLGRFVGPFRRNCHYHLEKEVQVLRDVPDITFKVTQKIDGEEETVYDEGFFDVRWNDDTIDFVTLEAGQNAIAAPCHDVPDVPCTDNPAILFAGLMPLGEDYHDNETGLATRPNRPDESGETEENAAADPVYPASAPYFRPVNLYGCLGTSGAKFYRLHYRYEGVTKTFKGLKWYLYGVVNGEFEYEEQSADEDGWYPAVEDPLEDEDSSENKKLLLNWPTRKFLDGLYEIELEIADENKNPIGRSEPVRLFVDNSRPEIEFLSLSWARDLSDLDQNPMSLTCPVINRPVGEEIYIRVTYNVRAMHLRNLRVRGHGCGGRGEEGRLVGTSPSGPAQYWHKGADDNAYLGEVIYKLPAASPQGAYSVRVSAYSRAFYPNDAEGQRKDWFYTSIAPPQRHSFLRIAIVDDTSETPSR